MIKFGMELMENLMVKAENGEFDFCSCNNFFKSMYPTESNDFIQKECKNACERNCFGNIGLNICSFYVNLNSIYSK
jgi:hypothetical protein